MEVGEGGREVVELLAEFGGGDELESSEGREGGCRLVG